MGRERQQQQKVLCYHDFKNESFFEKSTTGEILNISEATVMSLMFLLVLELPLLT